MEEIKEINENGVVKWGGTISEFLWKCAGVNRPILRQCPTDYAKYAGIGGTILFTALMAMLSGGYAIYKVFSDDVNGTTDQHAVIIAIFFGIFWGLLIFNLDRFMVNTMYSDGTPKITKEELRGGLPRICLAIFLGVVISTPIELRIFRDKIQAQIVADQGTVYSQINKTHDDVARQIKELEDEKEKNNQSLALLEQRLNEKEDRLYNETNGDGVTHKLGYGPAAKQLQQQVNRMRINKTTQENEIRRANEALDKRLAPLYNLQGGYGKDAKKAADSQKGLAAEISALYELSAWSNNKTLFFARLLVNLLFISIEVIPTFFKMMMSSGPYDDLMRAEQHRVRVLADKHISDINDEVNTEVSISTEKNKERLAAEMAANKDVMSNVAMAQAELLQTAINVWKAEEMEKIKKNPLAYIKTNTETENSESTLLSGSVMLSSKTEEEKQSNKV